MDMDPDLLKFRVAHGVERIVGLFERRNAGLRPSMGIPKEKNPGLSGGFCPFSRRG